MPFVPSYRLLEYSTTQHTGTLAFFKNNKTTLVDGWMDGCWFVTHEPDIRDWDAGGGTPRSKWLVVGTLLQQQQYYGWIEITTLVPVSYTRVACHDIYGFSLFRDL